MTELTDREPGRYEDSTWLVADEPTPAEAPAAASTTGGRRTAFAAAGLVAAGVLVGAVGVAALRPHASTAANGLVGFAQGQPQNGQQPSGQLPNGQPQGQGQGGFAGPGGGGFAGGPGGGDGEQHLAGTVTAVGGSSVTIRTASGTAKYAVTAQTEIVRNGSVASLSSIRPGDSVFVHLIPMGGNSYAVERMFAQATSTSSGSSSSGSSSSGSSSAGTKSPSGTTT